MPSIVEVFGNARVIRAIASGPLTDVFEAVQEPLGRHVAIKALRPTIAPTSPFASHLAREAELLSALCHENILEVYDFVRTDTTMWLVLEYVDGTSLSEVLANSGKLFPWAAVAIGLEVARALSHAHQMGIIHRDIKPSNIVIAKSGRVKLVDFGIAHDDRVPSSPEPLAAGATFGTPAYMSPEQILGEPVDARTDIFSLGIVLYQLIAGVRPFDAPDTQGTAQRIRHAAPPLLSRLVPDVPRAIELIVSRCLEKVPGDRYPSAQELAGALGAALAAERFESCRDLVSMQLVRAKIIEQPLVSPARRPSQAPIAAEAPRASLFSGLLGYIVLLVLVVAGGAAIQYRARRIEEQPTTKVGPLELLPARAGFLRVVAHPWAEVIIDGQPLDTTPFARPIPLSAGTHYVTLKHPKVQDQRRKIRIASGETALLDVSMGIEPPPSDAGAERPSNMPPEGPEAGTPSP